MVSEQVIYLMIRCQKKSFEVFKNPEEREGIVCRNKWNGEPSTRFPVLRYDCLSQQ